MVIQASVDIVAERLFCGVSVAIDASLTHAPVVKRDSPPNNTPNNTILLSRPHRKTLHWAVIQAV